LLCRSKGYHGRNSQPRLPLPHDARSLSKLLAMWPADDIVYFVASRVKRLVCDLSCGGKTARGNE
jgi:hypothetical protein